jgi:hypothetical protein
MKVTFKEEGHLYESFPAHSWTSVTTLIERSAEEFNAKEQAARSSRNPKSKWFGLSPKKIVALWDHENKRATDTGSLYHAQMESAAYKKGKKIHRGKEILVIPPIMDGSVKIARAQELEDGIYPEHLIYNEKLKVAGQSDLVFVSNGYVDIDDHKTNKVIEEFSYGYQYGNPQMMLAPVAHLMDCNYWHYALQLSIYMKLILLRNKHLKPGLLTLHHVDFEVIKRDQYGFPTIAMKDGFPIVRKKTKYLTPYMEKEAIAILKTLL